ncbi:MAG: DUF3644 domain-containing protein [Actinomycetes bacterium]
MVERKREGTLSNDERKIVKALLNKGWRNQDIQALVNVGRGATINSARITEVKGNQKQEAASDEEVEFFRIRKSSFDPRTGLNLFDDERLIRAREAMILAVQIFNSAALSFKTEVFSVLANIAWTYLLHEHYLRKGKKIVDDAGRTLLLSQMIEREDCPLSEGIRSNLRALKLIRDDVEHKSLGRADTRWFSLFQACCLNFDKSLCKLFGERMTLANELDLALQFTRMNVEQLATVNKYEIPAHIDVLDGRLQEGMTEEQLADLEYQFRVIYTIDATSKSRAHFEFVRPDSTEGKEIRNILVQYKSADDLYPYKPNHVCGAVQQRTGKKFTSHNHTQAWRLHKARPAAKVKQPENTNKDYCIYHVAQRGYTYSGKWIDRLVEEGVDDLKFAAIKAVKI